MTALEELPSPFTESHALSRARRVLNHIRVYGSSATWTADDVAILRNAFAASQGDWWQRGTASEHFPELRRQVKLLIRANPNEPRWLEIARAIGVPVDSALPNVAAVPAIEAAASELPNLRRQLTRVGQSIFTFRRIPPPWNDEEVRTMRTLIVAANARGTLPVRQQRAVDFLVRGIMQATNIVAYKSAWFDLMNVVDADVPEPSPYRTTFGGNSAAIEEFYAAGLDNVVD